MAKKTFVDKDIEEIKKGLLSKKILLGADLTLKNLKLGNLSVVYMASNSPVGLKQDIIKYAEINSTKVVELNYPNDELGTLCKKPFSVAVLGQLK